MIRRLITALLSIVIVLVLLLILAAKFLFPSTTYTDLAYYQALTEENHTMPKLETLGAYSDIALTYTHRKVISFESDCYKLAVTYDPAAYGLRKAALEQNYTFEEDPIEDLKDGLRSADFSLGLADYRMLDAQTYGLEYPKCMIFIGTSDADNCITYVFFQDEGLDYIDSSLSDFFSEQLG
ncbi:MAG: hypothetical protein ACI3V3_08720 [Faecousia sp.]